MTRTARRWLGASVGLGAVVALLLMGPCFPYQPAPDTTAAAGVNAAPDLDAYLAAREAQVAGLKPGLAKGIVWHDPVTKARTPLAIIYLHGFSASRKELSPVFEHVADSLGANIYFTRLAAHGLQDGEAFATVTPAMWMDDAREALAIGRRIGGRVVIAAMSSGVPLALHLVAETHDSTIAGLLVLSPNYMPADARAPFVSGPLGRPLARLIGGKYREFAVRNEAHAALWTRRYRVEGIPALMDLVNGAKSVDLGAFRVPVLTVWTHRDDVIRTDLVQERHAQFGSPFKRIVELDEAEGHELASTALMPRSVDPLVRQVLGFLRDAGIAPSTHH
jgi:esterase/lipase